MIHNPTSDDSFFAPSSNPIDILDPPALSSGELAEVNVLAGCKINASGRIDTYNFPGLSGKLREIWARVGGGTEISGNITGVGDTWEVNGIPDVHWSTTVVMQTLKVRAIFHNPGPDERTNNRNFKSTSGDPGCQYYYIDPEKTPLTIQEAMPRYFKVSAEFGGQQSFGMMAGGLLSQGALYLGYDSTSSTPERPVWRDIGLPKSVGAWLLRVIRTGACCYEARISIQAATETSVMPPATFLTRNWSFRKRNLLHGSMKIGNSETDVTLIVEPS